ncbi:cation transporter [Marinobacterium sp. D7]|uniref:cation transporter n=1 Tax=Marinobacterium ramblicola TaxID=2849041 RepID=UPI001C2D1219|nr:cation transporter [Marinobacterium ramblicola]MBV1788091.1 cation transporter [Marinobacterium ramblicola]
MTDLDHKPGLKEANLVTRRLKLNGMDGSGARLIDELDQLFGIDRVEYDPDAGILVFAYDATHCSVDVVETIVNQHGARFDTGWWSRTKRAYYRFVDQNMKENANYEPHCCNKVPRK